MPESKDQDGSLQKSLGAFRLLKGVVDTAGVYEEVTWHLRVPAAGSRTFTTSPFNSYHAKRANITSCSRWLSGWASAPATRGSLKLLQATTFTLPTARSMRVHHAYKQTACAGPAWAVGWGGIWPGVKPTHIFGVVKHQADHRVARRLIHKEEEVADPRADLHVEDVQLQICPQPDPHEDEELSHRPQ